MNCPSLDDVVRAKREADAEWRKVVRVWWTPFAGHAARVRTVRAYEAAIRAVGALVHSRAVAAHGAYAAPVRGGGRHYAVRADAYRAVLEEIGVSLGGEHLLVNSLPESDLEEHRRESASAVIDMYPSLLVGVKDVRREIISNYPIHDLRARQEVRAAAAQMPSVWTRLSNSDTATPLYVCSTLARPGTTRPRLGTLFRGDVMGPGLSDRGAGRPPSDDASTSTDVSTPIRRRWERWSRDPHPVAPHQDFDHDGTAWRVVAHGGSKVRRSTITINGWFGDIAVRARIARPSDVVWRVSAAHEFAHRVERLDARVFLATNSFLDRRSGPRLRVIDPLVGTLGREGAFIAPYTARDSGAVPPTEVFATGVEALWFGNYGGFEGAVMRGQTPPRDDEHRDLILGLFATATYDRSTRTMRKARVPRWL
jgi:hypothetical protein